MNAKQALVCGIAVVFAATIQAGAALAQDARPQVVVGFPKSATQPLPAPGDYVLASGVSRRVEDLVACAFRAAGLDHREFVHVTKRSQESKQVVTGLCGNPHKAEKELGWQRAWSFEETVQDLVLAELENRTELLRADPLPSRRGPATPA